MPYLPFTWSSVYTKKIHPFTEKLGNEARGKLKYKSKRNCHKSSVFMRFQEMSSNLCLSCTDFFRMFYCLDGLLFLGSIVPTTYVATATCDMSISKHCSSLIDEQQSEAIRLKQIFVASKSKLNRLKINLNSNVDKVKMNLRRWSIKLIA